MRVLSQLELARCSNSELQTLLAAIIADLPRIDDDRSLRAACANIQAIRAALVRAVFRPG